MLAQFYWNAVRSGVDTDGIPVYKDKVFVKITRDVTHTVNREADDDDFARFPDEYAYFRKSTAAYEPIEGRLPLEFWPIATPAEIMNLKGHGFRSVQDLARADVRKMPPVFSALVVNAQNYLRVAGESAKMTELVTQLTDENKDLKETLELARAEIRSLRATLTKEAAA